MDVKLLFHTPLSICVEAVRQCWDSFDKGDIYDTPTNNISDKDTELLNKVINQYRHSSVSEHLYYNFSINGISRALLQELARHRIASLSVKSTRYTLSQLKNDEGILQLDKYCVLSNNEAINLGNYRTLRQLQSILQNGTTNDVAKYMLPEAFKTDLRLTINARSLNNLFKLRSSKSALLEFQNLAHKLYDALPEEHKFLFQIEEKHGT